MLFFILCYCVNIVLKLNFPFILMILCTEENKRSFSGALKRLNPFVTSKTLFFLPEKFPFLQRFFWPESNWKIYFFLTWKISVFYTLFWPEWNWKIYFFMTWKISVFYTLFWPEWNWKNLLFHVIHEKSPFFTPFFWPEWNWKINLWHEKSLFLIDMFYVMMVVATLYKPNINAVAKHLSCVLLKFVTHQADVFKVSF